jgi:Mitochondrial carrier protein.
MLGGISTYISLIFGYPSDLIAKDIQLSPKDKDATVEAEKKMKYEGIKGFYKGISKAFAKNVIVGAATFLIYECAVSFLAGAQVL